MNGTVGVVMLSGLLALGVTACAPDGGTSDPGSAAPSVAGPSPTGEALVIEPATSIDGAQEWTSDGVTLAVPERMQKQRTENAGVVSLAIFEPDAPQDAVVVTVVPEQEGPYTEASVDEAVGVARAQIGAAGGTGLTISPVEWAAWPYAAAVQATLEQDGATKEGWVVQTTPPDGSILVGVSVKAAEGGLEDSWQYQVLRTVRPE